MGRLTNNERERLKNGISAYASLLPPNEKIQLSKLWRVLNEVGIPVTISGLAKKSNRREIQNLTGREVYTREESVGMSQPRRARTRRAPVDKKLKDIDLANASLPEIRQQTGVSAGSVRRRRKAPTMEQRQERRARTIAQHPESRGGRGHKKPPAP